MNATNHEYRGHNTAPCKEPLEGASPHPDSTPYQAPATAPTSDPVERLRAKLDRESESHPDAWKAEPGDELVGTFERWTSGTTRRGETHPIAIVRTTNGDPVAVWCFYAVLRAELQKAAPKPGELLAIRRLEDRENGEGQPYRVFRVVVDRDQNDPFTGADPPVDAEGDWIFTEGGGS